MKKIINIICNANAVEYEKLIFSLVKTEVVKSSKSEFLQQDVIKDDGHP